MASASWNRTNSWSRPLSCGAATLSWVVRVYLRRLCYRSVLHARNRRHCRDHFIVYWISESFRTRRTLFVRSLSHSPALCHLARAPHSGGSNLGVSLDYHPDVGGS